MFMTMIIELVMWGLFMLNNNLGLMLGIYICFVFRIFHYSLLWLLFTIIIIIIIIIK